MARRPVGTFDRNQKNVAKQKQIRDLGSAGFYDNPEAELAGADAAVARAAISSEQRRPLQSRTSVTIPYAPGESPEEQAAIAREASLSRIEEQYPSTTYRGAGINPNTRQEITPEEQLLGELVGYTADGRIDMSKVGELDGAMLELVITAMSDARNNRLALQQAQREAQREETEYQYLQEQRRLGDFMTQSELARSMFPEDSLRGAAYISDLAGQFGDVLPEGLAEATDPRPRAGRLVERGLRSLTGALSGRPTYGSAPAGEPLTPEEAVAALALTDPSYENLERWGKDYASESDIAEDIIGRGEEAQGFYDLVDKVEKRISEKATREEILREIARDASIFDLDQQAVDVVLMMYEAVMG